MAHPQLPAYEEASGMGVRALRTLARTLQLAPHRKIGSMSRAEVLTLMYGDTAPVLDASRPKPAAVPELPSRPRTATERSLQGKIGAHSRWAKPRARERQASKSREAFWRSMEDQVDPNRELPAAKRAEAARNAASAHMARLRLSQARKKADRDARTARPTPRSTTEG